MTESAVLYVDWHRLKKAWWNGNCAKPEVCIIHVFQSDIFFKMLNDVKRLLKLRLLAERIRCFEKRLLKLFLLAERMKCCGKRLWL